MGRYTGVAVSWGRRETAASLAVTSPHRSPQELRASANCIPRDQCRPSLRSGARACALSTPGETRPGSRKSTSTAEVDVCLWHYLRQRRFLVRAHTQHACTTRAHLSDRSAAALELLKDVHIGLAPPCQDFGRLAQLSGHYLYYHYGCDGLDDRGWGCGYRTLQTLCSWPQGQPSGVPGLVAVQEALEDMGDKPPGFRGSQSWIGCVEASLCLQHFRGPQGRLRHIPRGAGLREELEHLYSHFLGGGGPVMVGGDADAQSKALLGVCTGPEAYVLVLDPHYWGTSRNSRELQDAGWVSWRKVSTVFDLNSFYNLCLTGRT